jgi:hypothetical protein
MWKDASYNSTDIKNNRHNFAGFTWLAAVDYPHRSVSAHKIPGSSGTWRRFSDGG